uniref:Uncharacterized protein n=1 Tax=Setaria viridis TaxID=4556 RepID=A0A4U6TJA6_SETVI|nr:hypothetical protein SEVIR_8G166400v2 [Setaria viridis]TKW01225.1 hypothetical protein SEVIR_8G166400v2 [Setaria viridis]
MPLLATGWPEPPRPEACRHAANELRQHPSPPIPKQHAMSSLSSRCSSPIKLGASFSWKHCPSQSSIDSTATSKIPHLHWRNSSLSVSHRPIPRARSFLIPPRLRFPLPGRPSSPDSPPHGDPIRPFWLL